MPRFVAAALAALTLSLPAASSQSVPDGFAAVGQTLFGVPSSNVTAGVDFGRTVALSGDGTHLAVGAPFHGWTSSDGAGAVGLNDDGGGLFLYELVNGNTSWDLKYFLPGAAGEQMGDRLAISNDGSRIAVRRYSGSDFVEVYDVDGAGVATLLGAGAGSAALDCGAGVGGRTVSMSADGSRVAVSCENLPPTNSGGVRLFDYDDTSDVFTESLALNGTEPGAFLGLSTALSSDGDRLAISAPNANSNRGLVRVYEYDGASWAQVGADMEGDATTTGQFGFGLALAADGSTVVIGSPAYDPVSNSNVGNFLGRVQVFEFESISSSWTQVANTIDGYVDLGRFGRSVAVAKNGTRLAVSAFREVQGQRGRVRVMEVQEGVWTEITNEPMDGLDFEAHLGYENAISLSHSGEKLAGGAINGKSGGQEVGRVRVLKVLEPVDDSEAPSSSPSSSLAPSITSSLAPSISASLAPSSSPSISSSSSPTSSLDKFSWHIERTGNVTVSFDTANEDSEIQLTYNISRRDALVQIFTQDCLGVVDSTVAAVSSAETTPTSSEFDDLSVDIDIKQDAIVGSNIWQEVDLGGRIELCVRVDLVLPDQTTSVNFHEQKVFITVSLLDGFEVMDVDLDRIDASLDSQDTEVDYGLTACQCDESELCVPSTLTQGSLLRLCVKTEAPNVEILDIRSLRLVQGLLSVSTITDGVEDPLTTSSVSGKTATIFTQMRSAFFDADEPQDVDCFGTALLAFTNDAGRRSLRAISLPRALQEEEEDSAEFDTTVPLASKASSGAVGSAASTAVAIVALAGAIVVVA